MKTAAVREHEPLSATRHTNLLRLLNPRSIAVVGASADRSKAGSPGIALSRRSKVRRFDVDLARSVKSTGRELKRRSTLQLDSRRLDDPRPAVGVSLQHFAQLHGGPRERFHLELPYGVLHLVAADGEKHRPFPTLHHRIWKLRRGK